MDPGDVAFAALLFASAAGKLIGRISMKVHGGGRLKKQRERVMVQGNAWNTSGNWESTACGQSCKVGPRVLKLEIECHSVHGLRTMPTMQIPW